MAWEFPAVSQTRVEFWKQPQFTKSGMWWFTLLFGFFGLHHLYLRSPQTALIFLIANFLSLGFLWFYDLIQLSNVGESLENLNRHGLNTHIYNMGLAQGMWKEPESLMNSIGKMTGTGNGKEDEGPPNPFWFLLYCLIIPIAPLAQLVAGDTNNAVSRFLDLTIIPLGFLFYLCAFIYDYMILLIWPADLFVAGSKRFFPFTYLGMDADGHSSRLTGLSEIKPCPADGFITTMFRVSLPIMGIVAPGLAHNVKATLDTATKTKELVVDEGLEKINKATRIAKQASDLSSTLGSLAPMQIPQVQVPQIPVPQMPQMPQIPVPEVSNTKYIDATGKRFGTMVGGALPIEPFSPLDYAALGSLGAVIAGGFILSLNRSKNDPPPNPGRV
jgi:TM2 domain-containing membrane protein YozV